MRKYGLVLLSFIVLMAGCSISNTPAPSARNLAPDGEWKLTKIGSKEIVSNAMLTLNNGKISGFDGCNRFSGDYRLHEGRVIVEDHMISTMMFCSEELMENANAMRNTLAQMPRYVIDGGEELTFLSSKGDALIRFSPLSREMDAGSYEVLYYNDQKGKVLAVLPANSITMQLDENGRLFGKSGCNHYTTSYSLKGKNIHIGFAATTRKVCEENLMEQEIGFLTSLYKSEKWVHHDGRIEFRDENNTLMAVLIKH